MPELPAAAPVTPPPAPAAEAPVETKEQFLERLGAKNTRIVQLEGENATLRQKATGYDQAATQAQQAAAQRDQAAAALNYYRTAAPYGLKPEAIDHLAGTYAAQQQQLPEPQRTPWANWLNNAFNNPASLDAVAGAVVREHLASRPGSAPVPAAQPPAAPGAPGPAGAAPPTPPATPPWVPPVTPPPANAGVVPGPSPVDLTEAQISELVKKPKEFRAWKEANPEAWNRINRKR